MIWMGSNTGQRNILAQMNKRVSFTLEGNSFRILKLQEQKIHDDNVIHMLFNDLMDLVKDGKQNTKEYKEIYKSYRGIIDAKII